MTVVYFMTKTRLHRFAQRNMYKLAIHKLLHVT